MRENGFLLSLEALISLIIFLLMLGSFTHILGQKSYTDLILREKASSAVMGSSSEDIVSACKTNLPHFECSLENNSGSLLKIRKYLVTESGLDYIELYISKD
ncbi:MAG: hypothetical protein JXA43_02150 [Candidatus Diapherotrites archaeon]|nr:hypothetical protein [Candidatus Diapherotrites archaeon]